LLAVLKGQYRLQDQVVEIEGVVGFETALIFGIQQGRCLFEFGAGLFYRL
jgi:hypothetical protein